MQRPRVHKLLRGSFISSATGSLALDHLATTRAAKKAPETCQRGARQVTQRERVLHVGDARLMTRTRKGKVLRRRNGVPRNSHSKVIERYQRKVLGAVQIL